MSLICAATVQTEDKGLDHCSSASNICCGEARFEYQSYRVIRELKAVRKGVLLPCYEMELCR